jgi:hypothetical protein
MKIQRPSRDDAFRFTRPTRLILINAVWTFAGFISKMAMAGVALPRLEVTQEKLSLGALGHGQCGAFRNRDIRSQAIADNPATTGVQILKKAQ